MLRHLKRRQQELENVSQASNSLAANCLTAPDGIHNKATPLATSDDQASNRMRQQQQAAATNTKQQKRVRGRRSSKPAMEKRRRARINECLNILKSYVLNDSTNLSRLGIDSSASENQIDEETVACHILKSSGLINRHRGRKNPNKLEKADILELTVDYVRRLHEQRNEILLTSQQANPVAINMMTNRQPKSLNCELAFGQHVVPAHLSEPLTLDLSPKSRQFGQTNTNSMAPMLQAYVPPPNTPITPPSSASSLQGTADAVEPSFHKQQQQHHVTQMQLLSQVLEGHYKLYPDWATLSQIKDQ